MVSSFETPESTPSTPAVRKKKLRLKRKRRRMRPAMRYATIAACVLAVGLLAQFAIHTYRTAPRNTSAVAEPELRLNTLVLRVRVVRSIAFFQRPRLDYL